MEQSGSFAIPLGPIVLAIAAVILGFAAYRGERARGRELDRITQKRTTRAYWCFLVWGSFAICLGLTELGTAAEPLHVKQGWGMLVGLVGGIPAVIALLVGLFHAAMVWRQKLIKLLLLATAGFAALFASDLLLDTAFFTVPQGDIISIGYGLMAIVISVRGLAGLRRSSASSAA